MRVYRNSHSLITGEFRLAADDPNYRTALLEYPSAGVFFCADPDSDVCNPPITAALGWSFCGILDIATLQWLADRPVPQTEHPELTFIRSIGRSHPDGQPFPALHDILVKEFPVDPTDHATQS